MSKHIAVWLKLERETDFSASENEIKELEVGHVEVIYLIYLGIYVDQI